MSTAAQQRKGLKGRDKGGDTTVKKININFKGKLLQRTQDSAVNNPYYV